MEPFQGSAGKDVDRVASVITASTPDPSAFRSGRDFAAWLGLTPRQNSSGGKQTLGGITKQGNRYIRKLHVLSATSRLRSVSKRKGALADWISALLAKKPARLVSVALANKLARIIWAIMRTGESVRAPPFLQACPRGSCTDHSLNFGKRIETR
jgi:transposase